MTDETSDIVSVSRAHAHIVDRVHYDALLAAVDEAIKTLDKAAEVLEYGRCYDGCNAARNALIEARKRVTE